MAESAPLVSTADAPVPPGGEAEWFRGAGGVRLRAALFTPTARVRGSVVLSGGRTEPIEKYYEFIGECLERGFVVLAHDWRGQGLSAREAPDRLKGHARGYKPFLDDFQALLRTFEARLPRPWIAVGHSMGGALTLLAMARGERRFAGAMLSAPMLGVKTGKVAPGKARLAARLHCLLGRAARYVQGQPGKPFDDDFQGNILTHDRVRYARTVGLLAAEPQLGLGAPTWGWLDFAFQVTDYLTRPERLREITAPVIIAAAEDDRLVDNAAQAAAARHLPQGKLITVPGAYHEILMETDPMRNIFLRAFDALTGRAAPKPAAAPKPSAPPSAAKPVEPAPVAAAPAAAAPAPQVEPAAAPAPAARSAPEPKAAPAAKSAPKRAAAAKKPAVAKGAETVPARAASNQRAAVKPAVAKAAAKPAAKAAAKAAPAKPSAAAKPAAAKASSAKTAPVKVAAKATAKPAMAKPATPKPATAKPAAPKVAKAAAAAAVAPKTTAPRAAAKPARKPAAPKKA